MWDEIKYLIIDVDGTMTDGGIYYDEHGNELKKFNTRDAAAFRAAKAVGVEPIVLTGRSCKAVERRMKDLGVRYFYQGIVNKREKIRQLMKELHFSKEQLGYIGDDLNDLWAMQSACFVACPSDACEEVIEASHYVSVHKGGAGAVRDIITYLLKKQKRWDEAAKAIIAYYGAGC